MIDARGILAEWLTAHGYEGLYRPGPAEAHCTGCRVEELMCCEACPGECLPGYAVAGDMADPEAPDWEIVPERE